MGAGTGGTLMKIGTDIVECERIQHAMEAHPKQFPQMVFTEAEMASAPENPQARVAYFSGRWAAKEAIAKALGCGFGANCAWLELSIRNEEGGAPVAELSGSALETFRRLKGTALHISISHERHYATAVAVLEQEKP